MHDGMGNSVDLGLGGGVDLGPFPLPIGTFTLYTRDQRFGTTCALMSVEGKCHHVNSRILLSL